MLVLGLILVNVVILVTVLIPRLMGPLIATGNVALPMPTRVILGISTFLQSWWLVLVIVGVVAWLAARAGSPTRRTG